MYHYSNLKIGYDSLLLDMGSFSIDEEDLIFLIGPNGAGKSSFLKTLGKILPPISGQLDSKALTPTYLAPSPTIQDGLCGHDLLDLYSAFQSKWFSKNILEKFKIEKLLSTPLDQLSSGERQKILLSTVLLSPSDLVLLDEPLSYIDWSSGFILRNIIHEQRKQKRAFIISNHNLNWSILFENSTTWVLYQNQVLIKGKTEEVLESPQIKEAFDTRISLLEHSGKKFISILS